MPATDTLPPDVGGGTGGGGGLTAGGTGFGGTGFGGVVVAATNGGTGGEVVTVVGGAVVDGAVVDVTAVPDPRVVVSAESTEDAVLPGVTAADVAADVSAGARGERGERGERAILPDDEPELAEDAVDPRSLVVAAEPADAVPLALLVIAGVAVLFIVSRLTLLLLPPPPPPPPQAVNNNVSKLTENVILAFRI